MGITILRGYQLYAASEVNSFYGKDTFEGFIATLIPDDNDSFSWVTSYISSKEKKFSAKKKTTTKLYNMIITFRIYWMHAILPEKRGKCTIDNSYLQF